MEDEFDHIQGDIADLNNVDWDQILPAVSTANDTYNRQNSERSSSLDFSDEVFGPDTLEEIAEIERRALGRIGTTGNTTVESGSPSTAHTSRYFSNADEQSCAKVSEIGTSKKKRKRKVHPTGSISPSRKRSKTTSSTLAPGDFEDELTCPICCDIFVAAYAANPCGHSFCGPCGDEWTRKNRNDTCPICRAQLARDRPLIPNISMDSVVEKYISLLGQDNSGEWSADGEKFKEWYLKKAAWKANNETRMKPTTVNVIMYAGMDIRVERDFDTGSSPVGSPRRARRRRGRRYRGS